ncbi:MAG: PorV/PorQ family protein [Ignavibacteriales bacterium]|nr:PorV/PorQ family protein [Ignavibacteriales bacterium]
MKTNKNFSLILGILFIFSINTGVGQNRKLAQTGFKFLNVATDARFGAMGEAVTAVESYSTAMMFNPAGMANMDGLADISFGQTKWIADINYTHGTAAFKPFSGEYGIIGASFSYVDYGTLIRTTSGGGDIGYQELGTFKPYAMSFGVSYAIALSDKFKVGGTVRYAKQNLGEDHLIGFADSGRTEVRKSYAENNYAYDFGIMYKIGYKSLQMGMSVKNFAQEIEFVSESFQLPLTFRIGLSMDVLDLLEGFKKEDHSFLVSVDAVHHRDYPEQIAFGGEYTFMNMFSARFGYATPTDEKGITLGFGVQQELASYRVKLDYAYCDFGVFDAVHRITVNFTLPNYNF